MQNFSAANITDGKLHVTHDCYVKYRLRNNLKRLDVYNIISNNCFDREYSANKHQNDFKNYSTLKNAVMGVKVLILT